MVKLVVLVVVDVVVQHHQRSRERLEILQLILITQKFKDMLVKTVQALAAEVAAHLRLAPTLKMVVPVFR
jgi:hypothetical protein